MSSTARARDHVKFNKFLKDSEDSVWRVAHWLWQRGHHVRIGRKSQEHGREEWREASDDGDLEICLRVEVKGLSAQFTGPDDWPFSPHFIVCAKHAWDLAMPKPYGFIYISKDEHHLAFLKGDTSKFWTVERRKDGRMEEAEQDYYFVPMGLVSWGSFDD